MRRTRAPRGADLGVHLRQAAAFVVSFLVPAPALLALGFSASGPGGAIPDPAAAPGVWNQAWSGSALTSSITLPHPVASLSSVTLLGLQHTARGDLHVLLHGPQGTSWNLIVRPGFDGANAGDAGNLLLGDYRLVESGGTSLAQGATNLAGASYDQFLNSGAGSWSNGALDLPLSAIGGPSGTWTLEIRDWRHLDAGALAGWTLEGVEGGFATFCYGTGILATPCACGATGLAGRGCPNSVNAFGAGLVAEGLSALDNVGFHAAGEPASSLTVLLQGSSSVAGGLPFGDGVRCVGGNLQRLYLRNAANGVFEAPLAGEPGVRARSAALGDTIPNGSTRYYQAYYRDPSAGFCPAPQGSTYNITNAVAVTW